MKHTCTCGASIEVSSMYVATERIEWDRFRKDHEGCAKLRLPDTIRFKLPMDHPLVAMRSYHSATCMYCGESFPTYRKHVCGKVPASKADDGFDAWWEREIHNKDSYFYASMGNCHEHHKIWKAAQESMTCPTNPPKPS